MIDQHFEYEKLVIDPILNLIKDNQKYLTKRANLPQLAKLGYMYDTLWYAGRICWGSSGILRGDAKKTLSAEEREDYGMEKDEESNYWDCENNPKDKIEMCDPINEKIENLIYDAWGMHGHNEKVAVYFTDFYKLIKEGRQLNDYDIKRLKLNKTFDEWVDVLTDERYEYQYENRKAVACQLLCTLGSGYSLNKEGFVIENASGADQDKSLYGDWENAIFREDIQKVIDSILAMPEVVATIDETAKRKQIRCDEEKAKEDEQNESFYKRLEENGLWTKEEGRLHRKELFRRLDVVWAIFEEKLAKIKAENGNTTHTPKMGRRRSGKYTPYYPITDSSTLYAIFDKEKRKKLGIKEIHESYIAEAIRVCREILDNAEEENKAHHGTNNVEFAKKFLLPLLREERIDDILS